MTSVFLAIWLASATGGAAHEAPSAAHGSKASLEPPPLHGPTPPEAPAIKGPAPPAPPQFPDPQHAPVPSASKAGKKSPEPEGAETPTSKAGKKSPEPEGAQAPAAKSEAGHADAKVKKEASLGRGVPPPPTPTSAALRNELRMMSNGAKEAGPTPERVRLEQLADEIAKAREALRQETERLEELIRQRGSCDGELRAAAIAAAAAPGQGADAKAAKEADREQMESVSKAMKGMKPEQAAAVVSRLDHRLAAEILRRMRPADAGAVLGYVKPELAATLATEIATRRSTIPMKKGTP